MTGPGLDAGLMGWGWTRGYGLRGPPKAALSALQAAAAVMPPLAWARPDTPEADGEAEGFTEPEGLADEDGSEAWAVGVAAAGEAWAPCGVRPVKLEPRIRSTVPGVRPITRSEVT